VTEKLSHGEVTFFVRGRVFVSLDNHHHGSGHVAVVCNAPPGAQESLVAADPEIFFVPPYVGSKGWLGFRIDRDLDWGVVADLIGQAYATSAQHGKRKGI